MPTDLTITMPDRPGALVSAWAKLKEAGVNIDGACAFPERGATWGVLHVLVDDPDAARRAIGAAGFQVVNEREMEVFEVEDRPGALAEVLQGYVDQGRNIDLMYLAANNHWAIGTDDGHQARPGYTTLGEKRD